MATPDTGKTAHMHAIGVQIQFGPKLHVKCLQLTSPAEIWCCQNTFQTNLVLLDRGNNVFQRRAHSWINFREEKCLKVDWTVGSLIGDYWIHFRI